MGRNVLGAVSFEAPATWIDRSVAVYEAPDQGEGASKVTVSWLPRSAPNLRAHVMAWAKALSGTLGDLRLTDLEPLTVDGREAVRTTMTWTGPRGKMAGAVVHVDQPSTNEVLTLTCMCSALNQVSCIPMLDKLVASSRLGGPAAPEPREAAEEDLKLHFVPMPGRGR
jgi:hypothetical protein